MIRKDNVLPDLFVYAGQCGGEERVRSHRKYDLQKVIEPDDPGAVFVADAGELGEPGVFAVGQSGHAVGERDEVFAVEMLL